jgi:hypothetical protein
MDRRWIRIPLFLLLALIGFLGWRYLIASEPLRFGANAAPEQQGTRVMIYGYAITLLGVVLGSAYRELQARKQRGETRITSLRDFAGAVFLSLDFWMSLCGSPLVYALIWKSMSGGNIAGLSTIALQNGFCCTVIISSLISKPTQPTAGG